jgi:L-2,4-diaminobutyrate decarboxylase
MNLLQSAYDPESFRQQGHQLVDALADRLAASLRGEGNVCSTVAPADEWAHWQARMEQPPEEVAEFLAEFVERSIHLHHPRYVGHQVCAPAPAAALAGLVAELMNNGMAIYEMGPAATALERWVIQRTAAAFGMPEGDGFLTSGGTLATLTALLGARARQLGDAVLEHGTEPKWAIMTSEESHYCVTRAVQIMGWGKEGVVLVPTDDRCKMRVDLLDELYQQSVARGRTPIAVVGCACSTSTGSYDDLAAIGKFCASRKLWFHVDGAHGGAVAFCDELKQRLAGIEMADSVILDYHKMLLTPALATAVIFRERSASWAAFHQRAQYLWDESAGEEWHNVGRRSFECTKHSISVKIAALFRTGGVAIFVDYLSKVHQLALDFASLVRARERFELAVEPESNIVCFRHVSAAQEGSTIDAHNAEIRKLIVKSGEFYFVQTVIKGRTWLRCALMNPFTELAHLEALLDEIERVASLGAASSC